MASFVYDTLKVLINGVEMDVHQVDTTRDASRLATEYTLTGYVRDEATEAAEYIRKGGRYEYGAGSGIGISTEQFLSQNIGSWGDSRSDPITDIQKYTEKMLGGEKMREGTQGSYAYGVSQLAEGLGNAVDRGWITDDEAKLEMRCNISTTEAADRIAKYEADRIEALEKELAELREKA